MSYFNKLFGIYKDSSKYFCYFLGNKINFNSSKKNIKKTSNAENLINKLIQTNLSTALLHQKVFPQFKNIHKGKSIVIVACGQSASYYKPKEDAIHIGVNKSFLLKDILLDFLFMQDYEAVKDYIDKAVEYRPIQCKKFFGLTLEYKDYSCPKIIPESYAIKAEAYRYRTDWSPVENFVPSFSYDLSSTPLGCFGSIVFPALQFALWTNPEKIYLVGCDCAASGYFDNPKKNIEFETKELFYGWKQFKNFARRYYPHTEIISINPVGLKGLFTDEFTQDFCDKNVKNECLMKSFEDNELINYLRQNSFQKQLIKLEKKLQKKKVLIYGAGQLFEIIKRNYDLSKLNIIGVVDRKFTQQDTEFLGYKAIPVSKVQELEVDYILVSTLRYLDLIEKLEKDEFKGFSAKIIPLAENKKF